MIFALVFAVTTGCGESQEDKMLRAARRVRTPDDVPVQAPEPAVATPVVPPVPAASSAPQGSEAESMDLASDPQKAKEIATKPDAVSKLVEPITKRKPEQPLSDPVRRQRAVDNLEKISAAINKYAAETGGYPSPSIASSGGIPTLSWRVLILPQLGYPELFKKFDPNEPWSGPNNKKLLEMIPDEYVSPERFDTKTNYLLPASPGSLFESNGRHVEPSYVTDGLPNTILLLEVDDSLAIPWTKPGDFSNVDLNIKNGIGNLRGDGTFAIWANGWPVLLSNDLNWQLLSKAFTFDQGDGQNAAAVHRDISIGEVSVASVAKDSSTKQAMPAHSSSARKQEPEPKRDPAPIEMKIADAGKRLRGIYGDRIKEAKDWAAMVSLAEELLTESDAIDEDPASAFALQGAAIKLGSTAGSIETVLKAIDMRVTRFDVDAYKENLTALLSFGSECMNRSPGEVDGNVYLRRAIKTVFSAIQNDDYLSAGAIVNFSYRFLNQARDEPIPKSLSLLRIQLSTAKRQFDSAKESLAEYRDNSDDGEAAANFGKFVCFIKGDWESGLPLLAKGGSERLRALAAMDIRGADRAATMIEIGDSWWNLADSASSGVYRQGAYDRAVHWYQQAFSILPESLDKIHVKSRIDDAGNAGKSSPLAIVRSLAVDLDVDLDVSLAALAAVGGGRGSRLAIDANK